MRALPLSLSCLFLSLACAPELGVCDDAAAQRVVYDDDGLPAYEGQALVHVSCGRARFCHSAAAEGADRFGAPAGLDFDVAIVSGDDEPALARLAAGRDQITRRPRAILHEVERGTMPPWGRATEIPHADSPRYRRADGARLDYVDSHEGLEALRNWLACGAPVVERVEGEARIGEVVPRR
ncbi:MAG: hypothetical protein KF901_06040 [Myxococcales bacterium]|nr:hypothetical protein [Myxococcales bacterium]